jgi:transcriptional regulator with XRE-family HTH domain
MRIRDLSCENAGTVSSGAELGRWLRRQREKRAWARLEMARRLIQAARANGDTAIPGTGSLTRNIYRWERGTFSPSERYRLYNYQAFGISPEEFGAGPAQSLPYQITISAAEVAGLLDDLRAIFREYCAESHPTAEDLRISKDDGMAHLPDPGDAQQIWPPLNKVAFWH